MLLDLFYEYENFVLWKIKYTYTSWKKRKTKERSIGKYELLILLLLINQCTTLSWHGVKSWEMHMSEMKSFLGKDARHSREHVPANKLNLFPEYTSVSANDDIMYRKPSWYYRNMPITIARTCNGKWLLRTARRRMQIIATHPSVYANFLLQRKMSEKKPGQILVCIWRVSWESWYERQGGNPT